MPKAEVDFKKAVPAGVAGLHAALAAVSAALGHDTHLPHDEDSYAALYAVAAALLTMVAEHNHITIEQLTRRDPVVRRVLSHLLH
jgi:hypothetical protein